MLNKRFLWKSYVENQIAQKLVVNEKAVKMRSFETKLMVFYKNVLNTLQIRLRQKGGGQCPGGQTFVDFQTFWSNFD